VRRAFVLFALLSWLVACEQLEPLRRNAPVGMLRGHVRLADGAALPAYAPLDLAREPMHDRPRMPVPPECAAANEAARTAVTLGPTRGLAGVVLGASDFTRFRQRKPKLHEIAIRNCRLTPSIVAASEGDHLEIQNLDSFPFAPLVGPAYQVRALAPRKRMRAGVAPGEVDSIQCSRDAPCGRTDLMTFFHPVHTVSGADGAFEIPELPAGQLVRVTAWHPLFYEAETFVWLEPGQRGRAELALFPRERFVQPVAR
jgi:hypothetical protein